MAKLTKIALPGAAALAVILAVAFFGDLAPVEATDDDVDERLEVLNDIHELSRLTWAARYDDLRAHGDLNWVAWSQDGCSAPVFLVVLGSPVWNRVFADGCLRHDMTWQTLQFIDGDDGGEGRVWNERNRWIADEKFEDDNEDACDYFSASIWLDLFDHYDIVDTSCDTAEAGYYTAVRGLSGYSTDINATERTSVRAERSFIEYPTTGSVDCDVAARCLPLIYMTLDGKPFAGQNIPFIKTKQEVKVEVVRGRLQYPKGPPATTGYNRGVFVNTGEVVMTAEYPMRVSTNEGGTLCGEDQNPQTVYLDSNKYRPAYNFLDKKARKTTVYIKVCKNTDEPGKELIQFFPLEARYVPVGGVRYEAEEQNGGRIRHYQNIVASYCHAVVVELPVEIQGSLLPTDCLSTRAHGGYADFYHFSVSRWQDVWIDMWQEDGDYMDSYLYVIRGTSASGLEVGHDDDSHGATRRGAHIARTLSADTYTIVATNFGTGALLTGDYRLTIRDDDDICFSRPFLLSNEIEGEWGRYDCEAPQRRYAYGDYYTFDVVGDRRDTVYIDLDSDTEAFLYLIEGDDPSSLRYLDWDSGGGDDPAPYITERLEPGEYTIGVVTYYRWARGDYTLEISGLNR